MDAALSPSAKPTSGRGDNVPPAGGAATRVIGYENATNEKGERLIWLEPGVVDRLRALRGPGEGYSDVILRLAEEG